MANVLRLENLVGFQGRSNNVLYSSPKFHVPHQSVTVYFGGDIQDIQENMEKNQEQERFLNWSLDRTASLLGSHFSLDHILVVRPARMVDNVFSCFDNFVDSDDTGAPTHEANHGALLHLRLLLQSLFAHLCSNGFSNIPSVDDVSLRLIGFSKGCVVLNQFLYEFYNYTATLDKKDPIRQMMKRITDIYWMDGGHSKTSNTWITAPKILENLSKMKINLHVHVTPYQVEDKGRPWKKREESIFTETLRNYGASIQRTLHYADQPPSLSLHFQILSIFSVQNV